MSGMFYGTCGDRVSEDCYSDSGRHERWLLRGDVWVVFEHVDNTQRHGWVDYGRRVPVK